MAWSVDSLGRSLIDLLGSSASFIPRALTFLHHPVPSGRCDIPDDYAVLTISLVRTLFADRFDQPATFQIVL
jgi:hypothetical protein